MVSCVRAMHKRIEYMEYIAALFDFRQRKQQQIVKFCVCACESFVNAHTRSSK